MRTYMLFQKMEMMKYQQFPVIPYIVCVCVGVCVL